MMLKEHYLELADKYGHYSSWAIWADEGEKPKSNIGDLRIFDLEYNPGILDHLNPDIIMVGLNCSRKIDNERFVNFHDKRPQSQDYKIRYAFKNTKYYGAYMTDIIKGFEQAISGEVDTYLRLNKDFEEQNIFLFQNELSDLKSDNPLIIAFGTHSFNILSRHFKKKYEIIKIPHYSVYINKENYKYEVEQALRYF